MGNVVKKIWKPIENVITGARDASLAAVGIDMNPDVPEAKKLTGLTESERASIADDEAARQAKKAKGKTQSVLTAPLGGAPNVSTAVKKLGG